MDDRFGRCENVRCLEPLHPEDRTTLPWLAPLGFCPSCRAAVVIGFRHGATAVSVVATIVGALVALWRYFV